MMPDSTPDQRKIAGTIPVPNDRSRLVSNIAWLLVVLAYMPGSMAIHGVDLGSLFGWPVLHLWIIFVGPILIFGVYLYDAYARIGLDVEFDESVDIEQVEEEGS